MVTRRRPAVAGMFYEADPDALRAQIEWCFTHKLGPGKLPPKQPGSERLSVGFVAPHAGYMYSGPIAAHVYYQLAHEKKPETVVIVGPNHTGLGTLVSIMVEGVWETPLGEVEIDKELAMAIVKHSELADIDEKAHLFEHSVEVQIPFLQFIYGDGFRIVPIVMWDQSPRAARDLGEAVYHAARELKRDIVYIASSDFTHYEPHSVAVEKDKLAIERIIALDPEGLYKVVTERDITMCGPGPVMSLLYYAKLAGAKQGVLLRYATSGDITGDKSQVVGYAAIRIF